MYEYKIETYNVTYNVYAAENAMNELAEEGWRVIAISTNQVLGSCLVVTYERKTDN